MNDGSAALLFDFNGVIVDDEEQHRATLESLLAEEGIALTRTQYYDEYLGWNDRMSFVAAFRQAGRPLAPARLDALVAEKSRRYERMVEQSLTLVPGAAEFVARAAGWCCLAIVSGALRREIELVLDRAALRRHFEVIIAAEDVACCKPDPAGYLQALAALDGRGSLAAARCVAI
jgi:beta-phosphoglucomutase